jgi:hypothetical protein
MKRTTIAAPDDLFDRLREAARARGVPLAVLIREALEEKVHGQRPKPRSLGVGDSGRTDIAQRTADERPEPRSWR